jgi:hypothetical protein
MTSADFHPEAPCASQPLPSLASPQAASDLRSVHTPAAKPLTRADVARMVAKTRRGR